MSGAFSGDEAPSGVAADAFYGKGSSLGALLRILNDLPWHRRMPVGQESPHSSPRRQSSLSAALDGAPGLGFN